MASNYSYDPKNVSPISNSSLSASGPNGTEPEFVLPAQTPSTPHSDMPPAPSLASGQSLAPLVNGERASSQQRLSPGTELSDGKRYRIERMVAAGGMGAVYRAVDKRFNKPCAVKEMLDDFQSESERAQSVEWFSREASLLLELNHQCIPRVRDFFVDSGRHYLVMDFIEGRTMGTVLDQEAIVPGVNGARGVTEERTRQWGQQICSVLNYLHRLSPPIIFRDLKPTNIMVTDNDDIKLIDFGIARTFQSQRQATIIMTVGYAPQEQLIGNPEPRSDLYALGATLYRVLTRHDASNNKPTIFSFPPLRSLRPDVSPAFEHVIMKALAMFPDQRWSNAGEMERAILNLPPLPLGSMGTPPTPGRTELRPLANPNTPNSVRPSGPNIGPIAPPAQLGVNGPAGQQIIAATNAVTTGRVDEAYTLVQRAYGLEPNNALVHKLFGQVFARRQQADPAVQAYNRSLQLNVEDAETHKLLGDVWLFLRQQPLQAITEYIQAVRYNPRDYESHQRLAQSYERTQQFDLALRAYQEAVRLAPKQPTIVGPLQFALGQLAMRLNQFQTAEQAFVQVLMINAADYQARFLLSQAYEKQNKLEDAFRECSYVVGPLGQSNPAVLQLYQRLRAQLGR
ncbi:MAG: hypothetical protein NVS9B9_08980 [Ktedonobacteraceae bacterium]